MNTQSIKEINYSANIYHQMLVTQIYLTLLVQNIEIEKSSDFTYCELGCGYGESLLYQAMVHPRSQFYGIDYNAHHIACATLRAKNLGISNIEFIEADIKNFHELPKLKYDFIALHGFYSWIPKEVQEAIFSFIQQYLSSKGIVYISYNNAFRGGNLMTEKHMKYVWESSTPESAASETINFFKNLENKDNLPGSMLAFTKKPSASNISYLIHEYLPEGRNACSTAALEHLFGEIGNFSCFDCNWDRLSYKPALTKMIERSNSSIKKHSSFISFAKSMYASETHTSSLFVQNASYISEARKERLLRDLVFYLQYPIHSLKHESRYVTLKKGMNERFVWSFHKTLQKGPIYFSDNLLEADSERMLSYLLSLGKIGAVSTQHIQMKSPIASNLWNEHSINNLNSYLFLPKTKTLYCPDLVEILFLFKKFNPASFTRSKIEPLLDTSSCSLLEQALDCLEKQEDFLEEHFVEFLRNYDFAI
jgi:2-polyprenyl-3-methyl-5-hydroxy-6-metoxy-1,4-benzoquinol methylase